MCFLCGPYFLFSLTFYGTCIANCDEKLGVSSKKNCNTRYLFVNVNEIK